MRNVLQSVIVAAAVFAIGCPYGGNGTGTAPADGGVSMAGTGGAGGTGGGKAGIGGAAGTSGGKAGIGGAAGTGGVRDPGAVRQQRDGVAKTGQKPTVAPTDTKAAKAGLGAASKPTAQAGDSGDSTWVVQEDADGDGTPEDVNVLFDDETGELYVWYERVEDDCTFSILVTFYGDGAGNQGDGSGAYVMAAECNSSEDLLLGCEFDVDGVETECGVCTVQADLWICEDLGDGGECTCDTDFTCTADCACDPECDVDLECACDFDFTCTASCACDPECDVDLECACDFDFTCTAGCACDPECFGECACDFDFDCTPDCPCDPECG